MEEIVAMIHFPDDGGDRRCEILRQMKRFTQLCGRFMELKRECAWLDFYDEGLNGASYFYSVEDQEQIQRNGWEGMYQGEWSQLNAFVYYAESGATEGDPVRLSANLLPHPDAPWPFPDPSMENDEKYMTLCIPELLWKYINHSDYIQFIREACVALGASYACVDIGVPLTGMYGGWFRFFCEDRKGVSLNDRLPGIYWCQMVSQSMVAKTGSLKDIAAHVPCENVEMIHCKDEDRLWMQIAEEIREASHKKRLAMRSYLTDSLYPLSIGQMFNSSRLNWREWKDMCPADQRMMLQAMERVPLTNAEIAVFQKGVLSEVQ